MVTYFFFLLILFQYISFLSKVLDRCLGSEIVRNAIDILTDMSKSI